MIKQTHTYANLAVSRAAYDEIKGKLQEAKYDHLLEDEGTVVMQGIALVVEEPKRQPPLMISDLRKDIEHAINRYSAENGSNTPDFILAQYLIDALCAYDKAVTAREKWYGREPKPVPAGQAPPPPVGHFWAGSNDQFNVDGPCEVCGKKSSEHSSDLGKGVMP